MSTNFDSTISDVKIKVDETGKHRPPVAVKDMEGIYIVHNRRVQARVIAVVGPFPVEGGDEVLAKMTSTNYVPGIVEGMFQALDINALEAEVREQITRLNTVLSPGKKVNKARAANAEVAPEAPQTATPEALEQPAPIAEETALEPEVETAPEVEPAPEPKQEVCPEQEALREIYGLYASLSPENLYCDGEISASAAKKQAGRLNKQLKEVQKRINRQVTEDAAISLQMGNMSFDDLPPYYKRDRAKWENARKRAQEAAIAPEATPDTPEAEQAPEEPAVAPDALPEVGVRVSWEYNGDELTGTIAAQEDGTNIYQVDPDAEEYKGFFRVSTDQMTMI